MMRKQTIFAVLGALSLGLTACSSGGGGGGGPVVGANGCGDALADLAFVTCDGAKATITANVDKDLTLSSDYQWFIGDDYIEVGGGGVEISSEAQADAIRAAGVTLTVPAGTEVRAAGPAATLIITRGSKIMAVGTKDAPITFRSDADNYDGVGEWGGVIIQGWGEYWDEGGAPNCAGTNSYCNVEGEGGSGTFFGGSDNADNSGELKYVRFANGGLVAGPNNEVNGLTLQGVGYNTQIEYVQVHSNQDDGVEWFGGAVNLKHIVTTGNDDDDIDFDTGFRGNIQYWLSIKRTTRFSAGNDPRGIEANSSDEAYQPHTQAAIANVTLIGGGAVNSPTMEPGMRLRGAVNTDIYNTAVSGYEKECVRIDNADTDGTGANVVNSHVNLVNVVGTTCGEFYGHEVPDAQAGTGQQAFTYDDAFAIVENLANVGTTAITAVDNGSGFTFDQTDYIGAVAPGTAAADAWWAGWTIPGTVVMP